MKTLDEIINNEHYNRLNGALVSRSIELAEKIRSAMRSAEITEVGDYFIRTVRTNSGFSDSALYILVEIDTSYGSEIGYRSLENSKSGYYCNDFNCWIEAARGTDRLKFLRDARDILKEIDNIKETRIVDAENALKNVEGI